jgi:hypothetical protein
MPRRGVNRFSERELSRAYRAFSKMGAPVDRVEIDPATGRIAVILTKSADAATKNEWDEDGEPSTETR